MEICPFHGKFIIEKEYCHKHPVIFFEKEIDYKYSLIKDQEKKSETFIENSEYELKTLKNNYQFLVKKDYVTT